MTARFLTDESTGPRADFSWQGKGWLLLVFVAANELRGLAVAHEIARAAGWLA